MLKLSAGGSADKTAASSRNAKHVKYISTHGALTPDVAQRESNAAHIVYQATHRALFDEEGARLIGNAAVEGEEVARAEALANPGHQWRWVVSLHGDDAEALGYTSAADWHRLAKQVVPSLADAMGIQPEHLRWVAAHHDPTPAPGKDRHPHLHIAMWSAAPLDRPHRLTRDELRSCRRATVKVIHGPLHAKLKVERTALRDAIRTAGTRSLKDVLEIARSLRGRPAHTMLPPDQQALQERLQELAQHMPGRGKAALAYLPAEAKERVYQVTDWLLKTPPFADQVTQYRDVARNMAALYTADPETLARAEESAYADLRHRVGQLVTRAAADLNRDTRLAVAFNGPEPNVVGAVRGLLRQVGQALAQPSQPVAEQRSASRDGRGRDGRGADGRGRD